MRYGRRVHANFYQKMKHAEGEAMEVIPKLSKGK